MLLGVHHELAMNDEDEDEDMPPMLISTDAGAVGEVREFDSFEEAYAALMANAEAGQIIDIHDADCALDVGGSEDDCTCIPYRLKPGARA